jgi:hypothetical protein
MHTKLLQEVSSFSLVFIDECRDCRKICHDLFLRIPLKFLESVLHIRGIITYVADTASLNN